MVYIIYGGYLADGLYLFFFNARFTRHSLYALQSVWEMGYFSLAALLSSLTLIGGLLPMLLKKPKSYVSMHYNFMYWSVFGLYGAFCAEVLTRIPDVIQDGGIPNYVFFNMVGIAVFITMGVGYFIMGRKKKTWNTFDKFSDLSE